MKTYLKRSAAVIALVSVLVLASGCATNQLNVAAKSLATMDVMYDATMQASAEAYTQGLIGDEDKDKIITLGNVAHDSLALAWVALETSAKASEMESDSALAAALAAAKDNLGALVDTAVALGVSFKNILEHSDHSEGDENE